MESKTEQLLEIVLIDSTPIKSSAAISITFACCVVLVAAGILKPIE